MITRTIREQLEQIASDKDFAVRSAELTDVWSSVGIGVEAVEPVLRFMEEHPCIDFGAPGALVHFVECFYQRGYEDRLIASVKRKPTAATVSMLNAVINGTQDPDARQRLVTYMEDVRLSPLADENTLERVHGFLERLST